MSHRAQQIVDAAVAAHASMAANVYSHRTLTVSQEEMETPCVSIAIEADEPMSDLGVTNLAFIDSLLTLSVTVVSADSSEPDLIADLLDMRRQSHIAMFSAAGRDLGLSFVMGVRYLGAERPEINVDGQNMAGSITCRWGIPYRMNLTDPS